MKYQASLLKKSTCSLIAEIFDSKPGFSVTIIYLSENIWIYPSVSQIIGYSTTNSAICLVPTVIFNTLALLFCIISKEKLVGKSGKLALQPKNCYNTCGKVTESNTQWASVKKQLSHIMLIKRPSLYQEKKQCI